MGRNRRRGNKNSQQPKVDKFRLLMDRISDYTPIQPDDRIRLETTKDELVGRVIDLVAPIGRGQRVLVTSPPKAGKTTILQKIALAVKENHPEIHQTALLVDERPEEATDFRRNIPIEVFASTTDRGPAEHIRMVEEVFVQSMERLLNGEDVLILLDSITRLARAYNTKHGGTGRTMSGGVSAGALDRPRQLFGVARNFEEAGSLTIIGTALIDTGSRMDEVIFQEFKGTGNSELVLDRKIAERRIFPAVLISESGTRREELLHDDVEQKKSAPFRRKMANMGGPEAMDWLIKRLKKTQTNREFLKSMIS